MSKLFKCYMVNLLSFSFTSTDNKAPENSDTFLWSNTPPRGDSGNERHWQSRSNAFDIKLINE